ncbi:peptidase S8/S53 domain-containing protein, partial [Colletotrichum cereale]
MKLSLLSLTLATLADAQSSHLSYRNSSSTIPLRTSHPVTTKFSTSLSPSTVPSSSSSTASTKTSALSAGQTAIPIAGVVLILTAVGAGCYLYLGKDKAAMALAAGGTVQVPPAGIDGGVDPADVRRLDENSDEPDRYRNPPSSAPLSQSRAVTSSSWVTSTTSTVTSSSASVTPSAPVIPFLVYSSTELTPDEFDELETDLEKFAAPGKLVKLGQTNNERLYMLSCTDEVADKMMDDTRIAWVVEDDGLDEPDDSVTDGDVSIGPRIGVKPDAGPNGILVDRQGPALLSQPPGLKDVDPTELPGYAHGETGGRGVTVYIVDTGANPRHTQYTESPGKKRWIYVPEDLDRIEVDADGHGSCMQSIINGPVGGVAKNVDLVIVKIPLPLKVSALFSALILVDEDIKMNKLQGKAVVSLSLGIDIVNRTQTTATGKTVFKENHDATRVAMRTFISNILELDVPVVVSSGNGRKDWNNVEALPPLISQDTDLITVGSVDNSGLRTSFSQGTVDEVTISTVGYMICAQRSGAQTWIGNEGTSVSTPLVAGVIATWLGDPKYRDRLQVPGKVVANLKTLMKELQYIKKPASTDPNTGYP